GEAEASTSKPGATTPAAEKKEDPRPVPGEVATFVEELNEARLKPQVFATPETAAAAPTTTAAIAAAWAATVAQLKEAPVTTRIYVIRGVSRNGRPGQQSERVTVPVMEVVPPPSGVTAAFTESKVTLSWSAPAVVDPLAALGAAPVYNVYAGTAAAPLNPTPLATTTFERPGVEFGKEECFVVRTAVTRGNLTVESPASASTCVTATDTFPPAAPKGLSGVANVGAISLIWDANTESDLAGYIVLRGEVPGDKLEAITPASIRETTFTDKTVVPGTRYVYAIVAVDRATPANTSPQSARVEETAR
ncbi:MAG TPA: fibronectin type III domain-containing protein, partial [Vicinamibacterales bacterium]|nr:fibronectin type III domain-containing protein [Vicinamibacterales bacterium]